MVAIAGWELGGCEFVGCELVSGGLFSVGAVGIAMVVVVVGCAAGSRLDKALVFVAELVGAVDVDIEGVSCASGDGLFACGATG